ncbi:MAG: TM2 domain-containing protein [Bacteroidota bacterium]
MIRAMQFLPELQGQEMAYIESFLKDMTDEEAQTFAHIYRARRKDPQTVMLLAVVGLFAIWGIQRFYLDQIGMGLLYFFTGGLCLIGSIIDLVNYQSLANEYNTKAAREALSLMKANAQVRGSGQ